GRKGDVADPACGPRDKDKYARRRDELQELIEALIWRLGEPYRFERVPDRKRLYRVSRPGRSRGSKGIVPDDGVRQWIVAVADQLNGNRTIGESRRVDYVCLLGFKPDARREIADFYDARGPGDGDDAATRRKPSWEA